MSTQKSLCLLDRLEPSYRVISQEQAKNRWLRGIPEASQSDLIAEDSFEKWAELTWATDSQSQPLRTG